MPFRMRPTLLTLLVLTTCVASSPDARAGSIEIQFDLSASSVSALGLIEIPPGGSILTASATAVFSADVASSAGPGTIVPGRALLETLVLSGTVDAPLLGEVTLQGGFLVSLLQPVFATLTSGLGQASLIGPLLALAQVDLDCIGNEIVCEGIAGLVGGGLPLSLDTPLVFSPAAPIQLDNLNTPDAGFSQVFTLSLGGIGASVEFVGQEVGRSFSHDPVPEPAAWLLALGAAAVVRGFGGRWRRSRPSGL